jgi:protein ImuB
MRSRDAGEGGEITVRTAEPTRDTEHLCRLLAEHLAHVQLPAPVGDLHLLATEVQPLVERSASLLPDTVRQGETLHLVLERLAARLGPERVLRPVLKLAVRGNRPIHQGELQLLAGPQRVEGGWWDRVDDVATTRNVVRDYWVALSAHAGVLWVFQTRLDAAPAWYLHGHFA